MHACIARETSPSTLNAIKQLCPASKEHPACYVKWYMRLMTTGETRTRLAPTLQSQDKLALLGPGGLLCRPPSKRRGRARACQVCLCSPLARHRKTLYVYEMGTARRPTPGSRPASMESARQNGTQTRTAPADGSHRRQTRATRMQWRGKRSDEDRIGTRGLVARTKGHIVLDVVRNDAPSNGQTMRMPIPIVRKRARQCKRTLETPWVHFAPETRMCVLWLPLGQQHVACRVASWWDIGRRRPVPPTACRRLCQCHRFFVVSFGHAPQRDATSGPRRAGKRQGASGTRPASHVKHAKLEGLAYTTMASRRPPPFVRRPSLLASSTSPPCQAAPRPIGPAPPLSPLGHASARVKLLMCARESVRMEMAIVVQWNRGGGAGTAVAP